MGKTTIARILAKSLNCETGTTAEPCGECSACRQIDTGRFVDLLEIDAASNTGIDNIREVLENAQYAPTSGRFKVYIIDEVHMLSKSAFNAMLKTLEEPPAHVKFILATTDPQKVPVTVLSRCLQFSLRNMTPQQVAGHLAHMLDVEGIAYEAPALALLGRAASGSMRDAQSLLDQAIAYGLGEVKEDGVRAMLGAVDRRYLYALLQALAAGDGPQLMAEAEQLAERGISFDSALTELAVLLLQLALLQTVPQAVAADEPEREALQALADAIAPQDVQLYYQISIHGRKDLALAPDEHAGFNMTLLRMLAFHPVNAQPEAAAPRPPPPPRRRGPIRHRPRRRAAGVASRARLAGRRPECSSAACRAAAGRRGQRSGAGTRTRTRARGQPRTGPDSGRRAGKPAAAARGASGRRGRRGQGRRCRPGGCALGPGAAADEEMPSYLQAPPEEAVDYEFDGDWQALVTELGVKLGAARMLAHNAVLKDWSQHSLALAVPESFRHMTSRDYQDKLKLALRERFGRPVELTVTVEELGLETPAMKDARHRQEQLDIARENMKTIRWCSKWCVNSTRRCSSKPFNPLRSETIMFGKGGIAGLMKQAQQMQDNMKRRRKSWPRWKWKASPAPAWSRW